MQVWKSNHAAKQKGSLIAPFLFYFPFPPIEIMAHLKPM